MQTKMIHSSLGAAIRRISRLSAAALLALSLVPLRAFAAAEFPPDAVAALANLASTQMDANAKAKGIQDALNNISGKLGRPALAAEFLDAVLAAESGLDADLRGRFSCDRISVLRGINPMDAALVERRCRELAENAGIPGPYRGRAVWLLLETQYGTRDAAKRAETIAYAQAFLEKHAAIAPRDGVEIRYRLMRMAREAGDAPLRTATARALLSDSNAPASIRVDAASNLAAPLIDSGDFAAAEAVLREPWNIPKIGANEAANAVGAVARLRALAGDQDGALTVCREIPRLNATPAATKLAENLRGELLTSFGRATDATDMYLAAGRPADAANALDVALQKDKAREIRLKLLATPMPDGKPWDAGRRQAYEKLLDATPGNMDVIEKYFDQYASANTNAALRLFQNPIVTAQQPAFLYYGDFTNALRCYTLARRLVPVPDFKLAQAGITACAGLGDLAAAADIARDALAGEGLQPAEAYQLQLAARLLPIAAGEGKPEALAKMIQSAAEEVVKELKKKDPATAVGDGRRRGAALPPRVAGAACAPRALRTRRGGLRGFAARAIPAQGVPRALPRHAGFRPERLGRDSQSRAPCAAAAGPRLRRQHGLPRNRRHHRQPQWSRRGLCGGRQGRSREARRLAGRALRRIRHPLPLRI